MQPYTVEELEFINRGSKKEKTMFDTNEMIDTVQNAKKTWVKLAVQNDSIAKSMNEFVDAQTDYTKGAIKAATSATANIVAEFNKALGEVSSGAHFKHLQESVKSDIYSSFWKEAFKYYGVSK